MAKLSRLCYSSMTINQLDAYCIYNKSKKTINIKVYSSGAKKVERANHKITPGNKACLNWKELASDRTKEFYWVAASKSWIGEGYFPISSAITFRPSPEIVQLIPGRKMRLWEYWTRPWNLPKEPKPWQFKKR